MEYKYVGESVCDIVSKFKQIEFLISSFVFSLHNLVCARMLVEGEPWHDGKIPTL